MRQRAPKEIILTVQDGTHNVLSSALKQVRSFFLRLTGLSTISYRLDRNLSDISIANNKLSCALESLQRLEHFSHGTRATYIGDKRVLVRVVVGNANIAFIVEADDKLLTPWFVATGSYETDLTDFFVKHLSSKSHCLDVGANFGYFTCLMARFCPEGKVIGVEADEHICRLTRDNIAINNFGGIASVRNAAAGETNQPLTMYRRMGRSGNTSIASVPESFTREMGESPVVEFTTPGLRVDDLLSDFGGHLDFMKIDVEGAEPLVFRGARETFARNPNLTTVMEWSPHQIQHAGFDISDFVRELGELDLQAFDLVQGTEQSLSFDELVSLPYRAGITLRRTT